MARFINIGVTCENCGNKDGKDIKACKKCMSTNGRPGWVPGEGVTVQYSVDLITNRPCRRVI